MKVVSFDTALYSVPLTEAWGSSSYSFASLEIVAVWLQTDSGHTGTGWTFSVGNGGGAFRNLIENYLAPKVVGRDPLQIERIWNALWLESHDLGSGGVTTHAIAAIDIALWDLIGQHLGQPLYRLLGDYRDSLPGYGSGVNLHLSQDDLLAQIEDFLAQGYRSVKMKIGRDDPHEDLERVMAVRKLVGPSVGILVDANQKWFPPDTIRRVKLLEPANLFWLEEPALSDDVNGHIRIRQATHIPLAIGESLYTKHQFADWITRGACDYIQPNVYRVGGITEFMKIVKMAESHNVPVVPHYAMELAAHLGCATPNIISFEGLRGAWLHDMGVLVEPPDLRNGHIRPSDRPGHGLTIDRDGLAKHLVTDADLRARTPVTTRIDLN